MILFRATQKELLDSYHPESGFLQSGSILQALTEPPVDPFFSAPDPGSVRPAMPIRLATSSSRGFQYRIPRGDLDVVRADSRRLKTTCQVKFSYKRKIILIRRAARATSLSTDPRK
jgi:hypothetical protein